MKTDRRWGTQPAGCEVRKQNKAGILLGSIDLVNDSRKRDIEETYGGVSEDCSVGSLMPNMQFIISRPIQKEISRGREKYVTWEIHLD